MTQDVTLGAARAFFSKVVDAVRRFLPDGYERIPKDSDLAEERQRTLEGIVRMHAEGSVLLGAGRYVIDRDLLADEEQPPTRSPD